jgi:hypothetical protein
MASPGKKFPASQMCVLTTKMLPKAPAKPLAPARRPTDFEKFVKVVEQEFEPPKEQAPELAIIEDPFVPDIPAPTQLKGPGIQ